MRRTLVALDIDNTANDLDNQIVNVFLKNLKDRIVEPTRLRVHKRTTWDYKSMFPDLTPEDITQLLWYEYRDEIFNPKEVIPNGYLLPFLDRCKSSGIEVTFVSDNQLRTYVNLWVLCWVPRELYTGNLVGRKHLTKATWLLDDDPRVPERMLAQGRVDITVLTIQKPYNERHKKLAIVKNLEEAWPIIYALGRHS